MVKEREYRLKCKECGGRTRHTTHGFLLYNRRWACVRCGHIIYSRLNQI